MNRGYVQGNLDEDGKLKRFTSACGPLFFEGSAFPVDYQGNVFVCGPEANLIKRNSIDQYKLRRSGKQVWEGKEFLISSDEAFRPVNLQNGPDGALYIVDMHRGIIQHKTYMTSYLRDLYIKKGLDSIVGMGRILKIVKEGSTTHKRIDLTQLSLDNLLDSLSSDNIWVRNRAQQLIIDSRKPLLEAKLTDLLHTAENEITRIHALYTMEGLGILNKVHLSTKGLLKYAALSAHLLKLSAEEEIAISNTEIEDLMMGKNEMIDYHLAFYLSKRSDSRTLGYLALLLERYKEADWFLEPIFSGMAHKEEVIVQSMKGFEKTKNKINTLLATEKIIPNQGVIATDELTRGAALFRNRCASCHGPDGKGIQGLATPLLNSEYVSGKPSKLAAIMLYGLTGPIVVDGITYDMPTAMPGIGNDKTISDDDIRDIGNYIRNAFTTSPQNLKTNTVDSIRKLKRPLDKIYTVKELNESY